MVGMELLGFVSPMVNINTSVGQSIVAFVYFAICATR